MNIFTDGLTVLSNQIWTVFSILLAILWGQILITALLRKIFKDQLTNSDYMSLGLAGWILPVTFFSMLLFAGVFLFGEIAKVIISSLAVLALIYALVIQRLNRLPFFAGIAFVGVFAISLILQLAFIKKMLLPSYFDSAEHYRIIKYFSEYYASSGGSFPLVNYYHLGFHLLSATVAHVFHLSIVDAMLVFGQVILAILPFSLFFIVKQETGSTIAAVFTCLLAGVGWHMPAHVVDWGKYPTLFSLIGIHFILNIGYLICKHSQRKPERFALSWLFGLSVFVSALLHTRSIIIFVFMGISFLLMIWRKRLPLLFQRLVFALVTLLLIAEIIAVQNRSVFALLFETYIGQDIYATGLVIFLFIFSALAFPDLTFFLLVLLSLMMAGLFVPVTGVLGYGTLTLLDRPYVQMLLYLPLSMFGGLGLAGLHQFIQRFSFHPRLLSKLVNLLLIGIVILNAGVNHSFYSSDCCQIASHDDLSAIHWMDNMLPREVTVLIASANLYVTSLESPDTLTGVDGGIWVAPLISRKTAPMRGDVNFEQPEIHAEICKKNFGYIYVGGTSQSFNALQLDRHADWYQVAFSLPAAKVYQVIGCG
ncbi:MAG: hypothetical protein IPO22_07130 [Anaerolineales bacterium]|nr:hypothetical protein [Anaerolineales bacterium]